MGLADLCFQIESHLDHGSGIFWRGNELFPGEVVLPTFVVWLSSRGNIGLNSEAFHSRDIVAAEVAIIQGCRIGFAYLLARHSEWG